MCFKVHQKFKTRQAARYFGNNPKIATRNIRVYKMLEILDGILVSPFKCFEYKHNQHYTSNLGKSCIKYYIYQKSEWILEINRGLHSCATFDQANKVINEISKQFSKFKVFEMYIPKGAQYFFNGKEYVSTALVFKQLRKR